MKRKRSDSCSSSSDYTSDRVVRRAKHREGYNADWKEQYMWLLSVADRDKPEEICGLLCQLCQRHKMTQRSGAGTWVSKPCTVLHKDVIDCHSQSNMHKEAVECEATRLSVECHGGLQQAFQRQVCVQRRVVVGALRIVYCLAKQEIPFTTNMNQFLS